MDDLFLKRVLFDPLATSSRGLKKDYPWSDYLEKLPDPSDICLSILPNQI